MQDICIETETFQPIWENRTDSDSMEKNKHTDTIASKRVSVSLLPQWGGLSLEFDINLTFFLAVLNPEALPSQLEVTMILCGSFSFFRRDHQLSEVMVVKRGRRSVIVLVDGVHYKSRSSLPPAEPVSNQHRVCLQPSWTFVNDSFLE